MRRLLAHLVLLTILWGYVAPAALGATEAELPPCCRGNGKHHYAMAQSGRNFHAVLLRTTLAPIGVPEYLGGDKMMDDFCLDEDAGVAYVTTHRENTIDRMSLEPDRDEEREIVAGNPFDEELVGTSSGAWGRAPGEAGQVAFFTTDGGTTAPPPDGKIREAKVLRVFWRLGRRLPEKQTSDATLLSERTGTT